MRIGMVALDPDVHPQVSALCAALVRAGHEVVVYLPKDGETEPPDGVPAERIPVGPEEFADDRLGLRRAAAFGTELAGHLAAAPPHLLHAHDVRSGIAARAAVEANPLPVVQTLPRVRPLLMRGGRVRLDSQYLDAQRALARDATALLALSKAQAALLVSELKKRRAAVTVVPYGVDFGVFTPAGPAFARTPRPRVVAVAGRSLAGQGFDPLVRAMAAVPDAELVVCAGPADGQPDPQAAALHELAARAGVADRFRLVGTLPPAERAALLRSADVVACTPAWTPFGQYALEAMACGRPVVATGTGGLPDIVVDGATGTLVPPNKPRRLAAALRTLVGEPFWRDAYGSAGLDRAQARYSWDQVGADTLAVYEQALGSTAQASGDLMS